MPIIIVICCSCWCCWLVVIVRFNRRANPVPSRTSHNTVIEVIWTLAPVLILVVIAVPSINLLAAAVSSPRPRRRSDGQGDRPPMVLDLQISRQRRLRGHLEHPHRRRSGQGVQVGDRATAGAARRRQPHGRPGRRADPDPDHRRRRDPLVRGARRFWIKMDAVPGRINETWFKVDRPGLYYGQCSELCGARHGYMPIAVEVRDRSRSSRSGSQPMAARSARASRAERRDGQLAVSNPTARPRRRPRWPARPPPRPRTPPHRPSRPASPRRRTEAETMTDTTANAAFLPGARASRASCDARSPAGLLRALVHVDQPQGHRHALPDLRDHRGHHRRRRSRA